METTYSFIPYFYVFFKVLHFPDFNDSFDRQINIGYFVLKYIKITYYTRKFEYS